MLLSFVYFARTIQVMNAGMCRVLLHPLWGSAVYPASCFTTAPIDVVSRALQEHLPEQ
jgi:hypothetical protein